MLDIVFVHLINSIIACQQLAHFTPSVRRTNCLHDDVVLNEFESTLVIGKSQQNLGRVSALRLD